MNFPEDGNYYLGYAAKENAYIYIFKIQDGKIVIRSDTFDEIYDRCVEWIIYNGDWSYNKSKKWLLIKHSD